MHESSEEERRITEILRSGADGGNPIDRVFPVVHDELRRIAHAQLAGGRGRPTMSTTVLIHEAYLRLVDQDRVDFADRAHFFAYASRVMRTILVDYARSRGAIKRGGRWRAVPLDGQPLPIETQVELVLAVDEALERLAGLEPRLARLVECRFFGGMQDEETAAALGVSARTVRRDWLKARTWLHQELSEDGS